MTAAEAASSATVLPRLRADVVEHGPPWCGRLPLLSPLHVKRATRRRPQSSLRQPGPGRVPPPSTARLDSRSRHGAYQDERDVFDGAWEYRQPRTAPRPRLGTRAVEAGSPWNRHLTAQLRLLRVGSGQRRSAGRVRSLAVRRGSCRGPRRRWRGGVSTYLAGFGEGPSRRARRLSRSCRRAYTPRVDADSQSRSSRRSVAPTPP